MLVGILGTGDVGRSLGTGFVEAGHEVRLGSRQPANPKAGEWAAGLGPAASVGDFADAAAFGEVIVLSTLWSGTENALHLAGAAHLEGKVLIDTTNPLAFPQGGPPGLAVGHTDSGGEQVQRWVPGARVVKAFNTIGHAHMVHPDFPGGPPDMFICGEGAGAKATVTAILDEFGWPGQCVIDIGGIQGARLLEPLCMLWVLAGIRSGSRDHAFKLLRR